MHIPATLFVFLLSLSLLAQQSVQQLIDQWADDPYLKHASVGISVLDIESGKEIGDFNATKSLIPASNLKVVTTATALALLGNDFRFKTRIAYDGYIDAQGNLNGNLYIIGGGDPSLGSHDMNEAESMESVIRQFRLAIQQAGIRQITGRIIGDDRIFTSAATGSNWQWLDLGNYYGCGAFGLNLHENLYYLKFQQQSKLGTTPRVLRTEPNIPGMQFTNEIQSAAKGSGDNAYIYGAPYTYQRYLRGTIPVGSGVFTIKGSIPDPPLFVAWQLADALESVGILTLRPPASIRDLPAEQWPKANLSEIFVHKSPPLSAIVKRTNIKSVNLYAEALLRAIGLEYDQKGDTQTGLKAIEQYWTSRGVDFSGVQLYDGSGMAPRNALPANCFTQILSLVYKDDRLREDFLQSLPMAGRSGGLRNRLKNTKAEGRLMAKSGSLEQVRAYSGYVQARNGKWLAFSIMLNNYDGKGSVATKKLMSLMQGLAELH